MKSKFTWGHGVVLALLAFILFILGMVIFFPMGKQNAEMISDNYYQDELEFQKVIDAKKRSDELSENPDVKLQTDGILITFPEAFSNANTKFHFYLYRTDDHNLDVKKDFNLQEHQNFMIPKTVLQKGSYTLKLMWNSQNKDYQRDFILEWK